LGRGNDQDVIVRVYKGRQQRDAIGAFQKDAAKLAHQGYVPMSQSWAQGQWGCGAFLVAIVLFVVLIGILVFIYMLLVKPEGTLTVTYHRMSSPMGAPMIAQAVTPASSWASPAGKVAQPAVLPAEELRTCPRCAEQLKAAALMCRFCQFEFPPLDPTQLGSWRVAEAHRVPLVAGSIVGLGRYGTTIAIVVGGSSHWLADVSETRVESPAVGTIGLSRKSERIVLSHVDGPPTGVVVQTLASV
jgi:hypothetical protein